MLKKFNIVLIFLVLPLSINLGIGISLILPITLFYLLKDFKNIYYSYIPTLLTSIFFIQDKFIYIISMLVLTLLFYYLITRVLTNKKGKYTLLVIFSYFPSFHEESVTAQMYHLHYQRIYQDFHMLY